MARTTTKAAESLSETLDRVVRDRERIIIRRRGKGVAALVPMEDLAALEETEDRLDARDFRAAFGLGEDDKHINTVDADGVALAAIQALYRMLLEKEKQIEQQQAQIRQLQAEVTQLIKAMAERSGEISALGSGR